VSLLGAGASVLVTPLLVLVLWAGYLALLAGMLVPSAAGWASGVVEGLARAGVWCVRWLDALPGSCVAVPPVPAAWAWGATAFLVAWVRWGTRRRAWWWVLGAVAAAGWLGAAWWQDGRLPRGVEARLDMLAVGDGTCLVIRAGDEAMLWDCGRMRAGGIRPAVVRSLLALGVHRTPTLVITHPDLDHFGGLAEAVEGLGVRRVLVSERFVEQARGRPEGAAGVAMAYLRDRGVEVRVVSAGDQMRLGGATVAFLSPPAGAAWGADNDHSLAAAVRVWDARDTERSMLLTGDVEDRAIQGLAGLGLRPEVVELPHHGSAREAAVAWVGSMRPGVVMQSSGPSRAGDPRWEGVRAGRVWLCTATGGAAWAELRSDGTVRAGSLR
jgi:competence protein ComEC